MHPLSNCVMASSSLFTLLARQAADVLALVDSGKNHDHIMAVLDHNMSSKFPQLLQHCAIRGVEKLSRSEEKLSEDLCRVALKHALFGQRVLEVVSASHLEKFSFGSSGGGTNCRWISEEEASNLQPLRCLWRSHLPSDPPSESSP